MPLDIHLHPVYLAEVGSLDQSMLAAAIDLARDLRRADAALTRIMDAKRRRLLALVCLSYLANQGAPFEHCRYVLDSLSWDNPTPGERFQLAESSSRIGQTHRQKQEFETAVQIYRWALTVIEGLPVRVTTATLHHNLGVAYEQWGDHTAAADAFTRATELETILGRKQYIGEEQQRAEANRQMAAIDAEKRAMGLIEQGATARQAGNMKDALQYYLVARQHALRSGKRELIAEAAFGLSGIYFYQGEYGQARDILVSASEALEPKSLEAVQMRIRLATALAALRDATAADREFRAALEIASANGWMDEIDRCEYGLSQQAIDAHDYDTAEPILLRVLERRRSARSDVGRTIVELGNALNQLGFIAARRGRFDEAMRYHEEALSVRRGHDRRGSAESSHSLGYLHERNGQPRRALAHYARAVHFYEPIRREISTGSASRASFLDLVGNDYVDAARISCALGRGPLAWHVMQRMQNRTLVDGLARSPVERPSSVPRQLFDNEADLLVRLRAAEAEALAFHDVLRQLAALYDRQLRGVAPDYVRWRTGEPMSSKELLRTLASLGPGSAYVELLDLVQQTDGAEWRASLFGVCARAGDRAVRTLHSSTPVSGAKPTVGERPAIAASAARVIAGVAEIVGGPGHLFVVSHGPLTNFPLHILPVGGRQFLEWQPIRFLPHAGFLDSQRWLPRRRIASVAVLGDSRGDLPGAHAEAVHVAGLLGVTAKLGDQVTRDAIVEALVSADLVHIAGHAFFDTDRPTRSGLLTSDGVLTADELGRVPIRCAVAVLNACESGVHGVGVGNEIQGFVRALLVGGVRHVVCTLESVDDAVAQKFAAELYQRVRSARILDVVPAVWEAQRALARMHAGHSELWRPFILVG